MSPASMQYSLPSPLGAEPYWREVEGAPMAATEEEELLEEVLGEEEEGDTLLEMSEVQVWPAGPPGPAHLAAMEDSSLEGATASSSRADDSEGNTLSLPCSLGRPGSGASIMELEEEEVEVVEIEVEEERDRVRASGAVPKVNLNGQLGGQRSDGRRAAGVGGARGGAGVGGVPGSVEGLSVVTGQPGALQRCQGAGLSRAGEHNSEKR